MKNRYLLSTLLTFALVCFMTNVQAQCTKSKKSCSKTKTAQTKKSCSQSKSSCTKSYSYTSCAKNKKENCGKKNQNTSSWNDLNTLVFLGGAAFDNDSPSLTTGLEYERQVGNQVGLGLLSEVVLADEISVKIGIPLSYHFGKLKVSAAPLAAYNRQDVINTSGNSDDITTTDGTEWKMNLGARAGVSYMMNVGNVILAPTARIDYTDSKAIPSVGINLGFGF